MAVVPGFYQWLRVTPESSYGVYNSGGTPAWVRLAGDDAFSPQKVPARTVIRSADASNRRITNVSGRYALSAGLKTPLYPSQAQFWMTAAATLSGTPPNIASYTLDHFDGQAVRRYLGGVLGQFDLASQADQQYADLSMQWIAQSVDDAQTLAQPAETVFPGESPYLHEELVGRFTVGGTPIAQFDQFHLSIKNTIAAKFYESPTIAFAIWAGRDVDLTSHLTYVDTTWRGYYEGQTALTLAAEFYRSATKNLTLTFETVSILSDRNVTRPLGSVMEQGFTAQAFLDTAAGNDFAFIAAYS